LSASTLPYRCVPCHAFFPRQWLTTSRHAFAADSCSAHSATRAPAVATSAALLHCRRLPRCLVCPHSPVGWQALYDGPPDEQPAGGEVRPAARSLSAGGGGAALRCGASGGDPAFSVDLGLRVTLWTPFWRTLSALPAPLAAACAPGARRPGAAPGRHPRRNLKPSAPPTPLTLRPAPPLARRRRAAQRRARRRRGGRRGSVRRRSAVHDRHRGRAVAGPLPRVAAAACG